MRLVICEKPSVARNISSVLGAAERADGYFKGNGWTVSWCLGHLAEYAPPDAYDEKYRKWNFEDLPVVPEKWILEVPKDKKEQFGILKKLLLQKDIEYVVNACDAGREGELIFHNVYLLSGSHAPVKRLWVSSMEDSAIRYAFDHLEDGSRYDNLCKAAVCRSRADWLIGMNGTRAYTSKYFHRLTVGRVQTPTLAMLVERQKAIDAFVSEPYWTVELTADGLTVSSGPLNDENFADSLRRICQGRDGTVMSVNRTRRKERPPKLYDLTTLQRDANRTFGYTAQKTLEIAQCLYENKLITYPRTDSQYITDDMQDTVREILKELPDKVPFLNKVSTGKNIARIVDNKKVSDHTALLPTLESLCGDPEEFQEENRNIYYLICSRLAQAVSAECGYEDTKVTVSCENHEFKTQGRKILIPGWREIEEAFRNELKETEPEEEKNSRIPDWVVKGAVMPQVDAEKEQHKTTPPKPYTEDTLLKSMETAGNKEFDEDTEKKGLGTPATRASVIEKLISSGYAVRKGRQILPTEDGKALIEVVDDVIKSPSMTAEWENDLLRMEKGEVDPDKWLSGIYGQVDAILNACRNLTHEESNRFNRKETIGICPVCGRPVYETPRSFRCSGMSDDSCGFTLWKDTRYLAGMRKKIDMKTAKALLENGRAHMKGLYSVKKEKTFDADLVMSVENGQPGFSLDFKN